MADATEQLTGIIPTVVTGGVVLGFTKSAMSLGQQPSRRRKKNRKGKNSYSNFTGVSKKYSPW